MAGPREMVTGATSFPASKAEPELAPVIPMMAELTSRNLLRKSDLAPMRRKASTAVLSELARLRLAAATATMSPAELVEKPPAHPRRRYCK